MGSSQRDSFHPKNLEFNLRKAMRAVSNQQPAQAANYKVLPSSEFDAFDDEEEQDIFHIIHAHPVFQGLMMFLILLNAVTIGFETDLPHAFPWSILENTFLFIFLSELLVNMRVQGVHTFFNAEINPDFTWNIFDLTIVILGLIDFGMTTVLKEQSGGATVFRVLRLLRILRLVRIFKFLKKLLMLAVGFVEAVQALAWTTLLMFVALYICSILMVRTCGRLPDSDPHAAFLHSRFASIRTSMVTLFVLMSSPNLPEYMEEEGLLWERPGLLAFLVTFVLIGSFGMIALLTGVISESMFEKNQVRLEEARKEADRLHSILDGVCSQIYSVMHLDENNCAKRDEVERIAMPLVAKVFEQLNIEYSEHALQELAALMDTDGSGTIDEHEFKKSIGSFASGVNANSIQEVLFAVLHCTRRVENLERLMRARGSKREEQSKENSARLASKPMNVAEAKFVACPASEFGKAVASTAPLHLEFPDRSEAKVSESRATQQLAEDIIDAIRKDIDKHFHSFVDVQASMKRDLERVLEKSDGLQTCRCSELLPQNPVCKASAPLMPPLVPKLPPPPMPTSSRFVEERKEPPFLRTNYRASKDYFQQRLPTALPLWLPTDRPDDRDSPLSSADRIVCPRTQL